MGYGVTAYQYDREKLMSYFGYYPRTRYHIELILKREFKRLEKQMAPGPVRYIDIMNDFFDGKVSYTEEGYKYWYFLERLMDRTMYTAEERTARLDNSEWYPCPLSSFPYPQISELVMFDFEPFQNLKQPEDFPAVFRTKHERFPELKAQVKAVIKDIPQRKQFLEWIKTADKNRYDLFLFYY